MGRRKLRADAIVVEHAEVLQMGIRVPEECIDGLSDEALANALNAPCAKAVQRLDQLDALLRAGVFLARHEGQQLAGVFHVYRAARAAVKPTHGQARIGTQCNNQVWSIAMLMGAGRHCATLTPARPTNVMHTLFIHNLRVVVG